MTDSYFKYRPILFVFSLLLLLISCKKNKNTILPKPIYECKIFCSSESAPQNLINNHLWLSSDIAQDDIIIFAFDSLVYIDKIVIKQTENKNFDKIKKICVYSNNGTIGDFIPTDIKINHTIGFLILRIASTKVFHLTKFYRDSSEYQIAFGKLNKRCAIKKIKFFVNDSVEIKLRIQNISSPKRRLICERLANIVDYSGFEKTFTIKSSAEVFGLSKGSLADTIYHGHINTQGKLNFSKLIFSDKSFKSQKFISRFSFSRYFLHVQGLVSLRYDCPDDYFVDLKTLDTTIVEDVRYATTNNFTHKKIYDCAKCLMRYGVAKDFVKAQQEFLSMGYRIKIFDSYRPLSAQYKLWKMVPNINYVANPAKGSIHNRGAAVDMTLVDSLGKELDMGTGFDYFGIRAYPSFTALPKKVLENRNFMWRIMNKHGFRKIKTEWWHMSHFSCMKYPISNMPLPCH